MDATTPSQLPSLPNIDWVHSFPLGVGGAAPDARHYVFNGAPLRGRQYATTRGMRWVNDQFHGDPPDGELQQREGGRWGQWAYMGRWLDGYPMSGCVVLVNDLREALRGACHAVATTGAFGYGLIEWAPALVSIDGVTQPGLQIRSRAHGRELETVRYLREPMGIRQLLEFPVAAPESSSEGLAVVDPEQGELGRLVGKAYQVQMRLPIDLLAVVNDYR
jgi:hypothetical protein